MNIFMLDNDPKLAAIYHCDKHAIKMILETAQLLSTAHRVLDGKLYIDKTANNRSIKRWKLSSPMMERELYKATHINHPSAVWVRESKDNYIWTYELYKNLCKEYTYRYGKIHATDTKLTKLLSVLPTNIPDIGLTPIKQAMPDEYKNSDGVQAYRDYYNGEKTSMLVWKNRPTPSWIN